MFGSLVIVFPTPHEGGALLLRHRGREWTFDSGKALATKEEPSIGYAAFFSDIEHEVAPVISGHRITLTYNLYFDEDDPVSANDVRPTDPQPANEGEFREAFKRLLENPEFLPDGGALGFGLRHVYPIEDDLEHVHSVLKGSDAVVYQSVRALGYEPVLYLYYQDKPNSDQGVIIDKVADFPVFEPYDEEDNNRDNTLLEEGGILVGDPNEGEDSSYYRTPGNREQVEWVTPVTNLNLQKDAYLHYGNEVSLDWAYGDVCLIVRIGKAGDRLGYTTAEERKANQRWGDDWDEDQENA
jgi:hypothetical protein